jgi:hypothetical protein
MWLLLRTITFFHNSRRKLKYKSPNKINTWTHETNKNIDMLKCLWNFSYILNLMKIRKGENYINYDRPDEANTKYRKNFLNYMCYIVAVYITKHRDI